MERTQAKPSKTEGQLRACDLHQGRVLGCVRPFSWFSKENAQRYLIIFLRNNKRKAPEVHEHLQILPATSHLFEISHLNQRQMLFTCGKDSDAGRDWGQEEKGTTEDEMAGWHHWLDAHKSEWTPGVGDGQGGPACCDSWGPKSRTRPSDWTELSSFGRQILDHWTTREPLP